ncbi:hypothetical protein LTR95_014775 [Oleoguttula sp. CCFEE 5521]
MPLQHKVFISKRDSATRDGPPGSDHLRWVPTSSTLIYGERDAVLVDTQLTAGAANDLAEWVHASGKRLIAIYTTHAHGDHHFGTSIILKRFPDAKVLATPEVVTGMEHELSPKGLHGFWEKSFPGQLPLEFASAQALQEAEFELEGEKLVVVKLGHTDCDDSTALWVPSTGLLVAGDSVYSNTHPFMGQSGTIEARLEWCAALDKLAALHPKVVVGGHSDPDSSTEAEVIEGTKAYFENFNRIAESSNTAEEVYARMMEIYPTRLNPGSLWSGAKLVFPPTDQS